MSPFDASDLLPIGEFARLSQLSAKSLRRYDEAGLLVPAAIDPANGYRWYRAEQLPTARLIRMLRGLDVPLAAVADIVAAAVVDPAVAEQLLDRHVEALHQRHADRLALARHVRAAIRSEEDAVHPIQTVAVPACRVVTITRHRTIDQADAFLAEAWDELHGLLGDVRPALPFTVLVHGVVDDESDGPMEAILGWPPDLPEPAGATVRDEPAHEEARTPVTRAQWDYPAILAAYDAVAASPAVRARPSSPLACREVYRVDPRRAGVDEVLCDVAVPLG